MTGEEAQQKKHSKLLDFALQGKAADLHDKDGEDQPHQRFRNGNRKFGQLADRTSERINTDM